MVLRADPTLFELRSRSSTAAEGSPVPIRERIEAASAAGFQGLGLLHADLMPALDLPGIITALRTAGWHGPWGVEILSDEHRKTPVRPAVADAFRTARIELNRS